MQAELICSGCFDLTLGSTEWVCQHLFVEKTNSSGLHRGSAPPRVTVLGMKQLLVPWLFFSLSSAGSSGEASSCAPKSLLPGEEPCVCSCPWHGCLTAPLAALLHTAVSRGFGTKKKVYFRLRVFLCSTFFFVLFLFDSHDSLSSLLWKI